LTLGVNKYKRFISSLPKVVGGYIYGVSPAKLEKNEMISAAFLALLVERYGIHVSEPPITRCGLSA
jgi:hypothetical protein